MDRNLTTYCGHPGLVTDVKSRPEMRIIRTFLGQPYDWDRSQAMTMRWTKARTAIWKAVTVMPLHPRQLTIIFFLFQHVLYAARSITLQSTQ